MTNQTDDSKIGFKVEIKDDRIMSRPYTERDIAMDYIRDLIHCTEAYQKLKWYQLVKQNILVCKIQRKAEDLYGLLSKPKVYDKR